MSGEPSPDQSHCDLDQHEECSGYTEDEGDPETCFCPCHDDIQMGAPQWSGMDRRLVGFPRRDDGLDAIVIAGEAFRRRDLRDAADQPAFAVTSKARSWSVFTADHLALEATAGRQLTVAEIGSLQGFRLDYPWHGSRTCVAEQAGNAVPPPMAATLIQTLFPNGVPA